MLEDLRPHTDFMPLSPRALPAPATRAPVRAVAASRRPWSQPPHVNEPILDAARAPLAAWFSRGGPSWHPYRKLGMLIWLRLLRPLVTVAAWIAGMAYAWSYAVDAPAQADTKRLLELYAFIIAAIFAVMLVMAPLRRRRHLGSADFKSEESTLMALADFVEVAPAELSLYQRAKRMSVLHNAQGRLHSARVGSAGRHRVAWDGAPG